MKGAIGNAFILNIVITFVIIFFSLLIGSMAYSKAYKTKNFLLDSIKIYNERYNNTLEVAFEMPLFEEAWDEIVNPTLRDFGYSLATEDNTCPNKEEKNYQIIRNTKVGKYEYCIYTRRHIENFSSGRKMLINNYLVLIYMKFDFPIIGDFIKIPITGESQPYQQLSNQT